MAFWDTEKSVTSGQPIELHQFHSRDTTTYWRYADAPADVTYSGNVYRARWIEGAGIEQGSNALKNQTTVRTDWACPFVAQYKIAPPEQVIDYTRHKAHGDDFITSFIGVVVAVRFKQTDRTGKRYAEIFIDPASNDLREAGLVLRAGRQCQVALYSTPCAIARNLWKASGTVTTVTGTTLTISVSGYPVGWFKGGDFVTATARRKVIYHVGTTIILARSIYGLAAGEAFDIYAGCDHTALACVDKFDNLDNYRGQPLIPDSDPWGDMVL
jgi:hypothetical protein